MNTETDEISTRSQRRNRRSRADNAPPISGGKKSKQPAIGLGVELQTVCEDVVTVPYSRKQTTHTETGVITEAERITFPPAKGDERPYWQEDKDCQTVYVEKHLGFKAKPIDQFEQQQEAKQRRLAEAATVQGISERVNTGLYFAQGLYSFIQAIGHVVLGLMAGASLVQTLYIQSFGVSKEVDFDGRVITKNENGLLLVQRYGPYAEPVTIAYYIGFILAGSFILDRFDVAHLTSKCVAGCFTFGNGAIGVVLFIGAFGVNNAMASYDYSLIDLANRPSAEISSLWATETSYETNLRVWRVLDACRTALLVATWIVISVSRPRNDRLLQRMQTDPNNARY